MKTLILGTSYVTDAGDGAQNYGSALVTLWADVMQKLNPGTDILIVDSASPIDPAVFLSGRSISVLQLENNIGHINISGRDGWGRAFCAGVQYAIEEGYDYVAYCDVDIILAKPVGPIIEKMAKYGVEAACPMDMQYNFLENGLMFLDVGYLKDSDFIARYDWKSRTRSADPMDIPEMVFERLMGDALFTLPIRTYRDDFKRITPNNIEHAFPYGIDAITHMASMEVYHRFLEMKGIEL